MNADARVWRVFYANIGYFATDVLILRLSLPGE